MGEERITAADKPPETIMYASYTPFAQTWPPGNLKIEVVLKRYKIFYCVRARTCNDLKRCFFARSETGSRLFSTRITLDESITQSVLSSR